MSEAIELSTICSDTLIHRYEELRASVLESTTSCSVIPGFAIIVFRGMAAWMKATPSFASFPEPAVSEQSQCLRQQNPLSAPLSREVAVILTNIVMNHHEQARCVRA